MGTASAVLFSGGLDSAVLLASESRSAARVQPVHVRSGLAWEDAEARAIQRLMAVPPLSRVPRAVTLTVDMRDVYPPTHWAVRGQPPAYDTPDEDVYLEGRNLVLISKAATLGARLGLQRIALGSLNGNPFPDASPEFLEAMSRALSLGLAQPFSVVTPLSQMQKDDVIKLGVELGVPLELTLSCMNPSDDRHCGRCSKCRERHDAFIAAGMNDPTMYASAPGA